MRRLLSLVPLVALLAACGGSSPTAPTTIPPQAYSATDLRVGTGAEAVDGKVVTVHYTLWLFSTTGVDNKGTLVQSSVGGTPFVFTLASGGAIPGFDRGVVGMKVGGTRRLVVPPALAYGAAGTQGIPPNSNLIFEVELLSVQ